MRHVQWRYFAVRNSNGHYCENTTFKGPEEYLRSRGVQLDIIDDEECKRMMREFIAERPELWHEDIGV